MKLYLFLLGLANLNSHNKENSRHHLFIKHALIYSAREISNKTRMDMKVYTNASHKKMPHLTNSFSLYEKNTQCTSKCIQIYTFTYYKVFLTLCKTFFLIDHFTGLT